MPNDYEIFDHQMSEVNRALGEIVNSYAYLLNKRLKNNLTRSEYMIYDMMDMLIPLKALMLEVKSGTMYPDYMVEKLSNINRYIETTLEYFKSLD